MDKIRLSNCAIEAYPEADDGTRLVRFDKHPFLLMKVGKRRKSFYVDFWHRNQHYQRKLGVFPAMNADEVLNEGQRIYREVLSGGVLPTVQTLSRFFIDFYAPMIKVTNRSYQDDVDRYKNHIHPVLGTLPMADIRAIQVQKLLNKLAETLSPATVNLNRALLHRMYEVAIRYDFVNTNPVKKTERLNVDNVNNRILTSEEEERFVQVCLEERTNPSAMALLLALLTGARISNICELKWDNVDLDNQAILLTRTKSTKQQLVPLSTESVTLLRMEQTFRVGPYVFSKHPMGLEPISYPRSVFTRLCQKAGISTTGALHEGRNGFPAEPVTIHSLRKTNASRVLQKHNDIYLCKEIMGHSDIKVTGRYAFYLSDQVRGAVEGIFKLPENFCTPVGDVERQTKLPKA